MTAETKQQVGTDTTKQKHIKLFEHAENILTAIILFAVIVLAIVIVYNFFHFTKMPIPWKIAISIFILILPVCLFLQAFLNVGAVQEERIAKIEEGFRKAYAKYMKEKKPPIIEDKDVDDEKTFRLLIQDRTSFLIDDGQLYSIYRNAYQIYNTVLNGRLNIGAVSIREIRYWFTRFELDELLSRIIKRKMKEDGSDFKSYTLPIAFFLFMYFSGFLVVAPFVYSIFNPGDHVNSAYIPLFDNQHIPILVIQWGFLGGLVYTSISLLSRFLRNDLIPRVYFNAAFRLILSAVVAIIIYYIYMFVDPAANNTPPQILLLCFLAGVAPIQFLINFADTQLSKINEGWKRRSTSGNRPITQLEGIDSVTAERLSEEGIDFIQEMALCNYIELSAKTNFPLELVNNWKDQAILQILTGDVIVNTDPKNKEFLNDIIDEKLGIRTISSFIDLGNTIADKKLNGTDEYKLFLSSLFNFDGNNEKDQNKYIQAKYTFENIVTQGKKLLSNYIQKYDLDDLASTDTTKQQVGTDTTKQ